jgi:parallel beta-helix repeat protein
LVEGNVVSNNKLGGIAISGAPGCAVRHNDIENNVGSGLFVVNDATGAMTASVARNRIASNKGGGLALDMQDQAGPISIVENEFASNQGFGLSALHWPASAAPGLVDLGRNWWGTSDGPSGIFGGTGNAVLGTPPVDTVLAPILPCPMYAGPSPSSMQVLAYPQTAILPLFSAAGTFVIDRLGTAGLRMAFYGGERSAHGWVTMATYTSQALANEFVLTRGRAVRAAAVLVSGFAGGQVEIAMPYDATELGAADPTRLCLYAYEGGSWQAEPGTGELGLVGGELQPLVSHVAVGSHVVIAELDVSQLAGRVSAILLVLRD